VAAIPTEPAVTLRSQRDRLRSVFAAAALHW